MYSISLLSREGNCECSVEEEKIRDSDDWQSLSTVQGEGEYIHSVLFLTQNFSIFVFQYIISLENGKIKNQGSYKDIIEDFSKASQGRWGEVFISLSMTMQNTKTVSKQC